MFSVKPNAEHVSATCKLHFADYMAEDGSTRRVAMKFMKNKDQFITETLHRRAKQLDSKFVIEMMMSYDADNSAVYRKEIVSRGYADYPYLVVMEAADRNLQSILKHERLKEKPELLRGIFISIVRCVMYLHSKGLIHGDIKRKCEALSC